MHWRRYSFKRFRDSHNPTPTGIRETAVGGKFDAVFASYGIQAERIDVSIIQITYDMDHHSETPNLSYVLICVVLVLCIAFSVIYCWKQWKERLRRGNHEELTASICFASGCTFVGDSRSLALTDQNLDFADVSGRHAPLPLSASAQKGIITSDIGPSAIISGKSVL